MSNRFPTLDVHRRRETAWLGRFSSDDDLRGLARRRLEELLNSDDERVRLNAARSLFSYGTTNPPHDTAAVTPAASVEHDYGAILDVLEGIGLVYRGPGLLDERRRELSEQNAKLQQRVRELERELRSPQTSAESKSVGPKPAEVTAPAPASVASAQSTADLPGAGTWLFRRDRKP